MTGTVELFTCADVLVGDSAGHDLALYAHRSRPKLLAVKAGASGGSAQVHIGPIEARDLAKALTEWADSYTEQGGGERDSADIEVAIRVTGKTAFRLRHILPILNQALDPLPDSEDRANFQVMLNEVVAAVDRALPADLRTDVDERQIAESRMNAIDAQRAAGVRPGPETEETLS